MPARRISYLRRGCLSGGTLKESHANRVLHEWTHATRFSGSNPGLGQFYGDALECSITVATSSTQPITCADNVDTVPVNAGDDVWATMSTPSPPASLDMIVMNVSLEKQ